MKSLTQVTIAAAVGALLAMPSTKAQAQPPRQMGGEQISRARRACDDAAAQAGYRVVRHDRENMNGNSYQLPMHVSHGSNESDITCSYDMQRGLATVPPWAGRREGESNGRLDRDDRNGRQGDYADRAQRACENYINRRRGWQVVQVGAPTEHGRRQVEIPFTVNRNGRGQETVTCRYNNANGKVSMH